MYTRELEGVEELIFSLKQKQQLAHFQFFLLSKKLASDTKQEFQILQVSVFSCFVLFCFVLFFFFSFIRVSWELGTENEEYSIQESIYFVLKEFPMDAAFS